MFYDTAAEKDPDDPYNPFSLLAVVMLLGNTSNEAEAALAPEVKEILSAAGCLGDGDDVERVWQYDYHKDVITDEVTLYFTLESDASNDRGFIIISDDCTDAPRDLFVDVNVNYIGEVGQVQNITVRFGAGGGFCGEVEIDEGRGFSRSHYGDVTCSTTGKGFKIYQPNPIGRYGRHTISWQ